MKSRLLKISFIVMLVLSLLLTSFGSVAAAPSDEPPGLQRAIEAKNRHTDEILSVPGVNGIGVGLGENGEAVIIILTEKAGIRGLPSSIEGVPAFTKVSGVFVALAQPSDKAPSNKVRPPKNQAPVVTITSPIDGGIYESDTPILFEGTVIDEDDSLSESLKWESDGINIGTGPNFKATLQAGTHTITAWVTDSGGKTGSASVQITVGGASISLRWETRPVPIGVSTGHSNITAGTIGARITDGARVFALSNNHVYADENHAIIGDNVLQPGVYDGGRNPIDKIGTLYAFIPIVFSRRANNEVDAAIALSDLDSLGNSTPSEDGYGIPASTTMGVSTGQSVKKYGRTTSLTSGVVYLVDTTVIVQYDSGLARFVHQIVITPGTFSAGGDSGSLIVDSASNKPVGLLFAGSSSHTIANPIHTVLDKLSEVLSNETGEDIILSIDGN